MKGSGGTPCDAPCLRQWQTRSDQCSQKCIHRRPRQKCCGQRSLEGETYEEVQERCCLKPLTLAHNPPTIPR